MHTRRAAFGVALGLLVLGLLVLGLLVLGTPHARADQPSDFMLSLQPSGTFVLLDYFGTGAQATIENRLPIYRDANDLTIALSLVPAYTLGEAVARVDLRALFVSIGGSLGYRVVWRDLTFDAGKDSYCVRCDRASRREIDGFFKPTPGTDRYGMAEGRVRLYFPFNDYFVMDAVASARYEDRHDRSYDWFYTSVYDRGVLGRFELEMFVKHPNWGGIGPYLQLLMLPRDGQHVAQFAFGFNAVRRLGLLTRDDLLFLTFLMKPGDGVYGQQSYYAPIRALLIYRVILGL